MIKKALSKSNFVDYIGDYNYYILYKTDIQPLKVAAALTWNLS